MNGLEIAGFIALGLIAGGYGALLGLGGGVLVVPALILIHVAPKEAAGTSMVVILANSLSGSLSYLHQRRVDLRAGLAFSVTALPGAFLGALLDQYLPGRLFTLLFAVLLTIIGVRMYLSHGDAPAQPNRPSGKPGKYGFSLALAMTIGLGAGVIASAFGVGGGIIFVPAMVYVFGFPAVVAIATSTFIIALTSIFATASHAYYHDVLWGPAVAICIGAVIGAQFGSRLAPRLEHAHLLRLFCLAVFLTALWLFYKAIA